MRRTHRNLILFVGLALAGYLVTSALTSSIKSSGPSPPETGPGGEDAYSPDGEVDASTGASPVAPSPAASSPAPVEDAAEPPDKGVREYAIALYELRGLPPDAPAGTRLEIWAVWKPPVTKQRQVQRLVTGVRLDRIAPPVTSEGPPVAILDVPEKELSDLLFGDRFGDLSAVVLP